MTLQDLHRKVEEASGPSREIDRDLFVEFDPARALSAFNRGKTGMPVPRLPLNLGGLGGAAVMNAAPRYTASVDAALGLVERMLPGWAVEMERWSAGCTVRLWECDDKGWHSAGSGRVESRAASLPIAILLALLRAISPIQSGGSDA